MNIEYSADVAARQMNGSRSEQTPRRQITLSGTLRVYHPRRPGGSESGTTFTTNILSNRLTAPGSPRMRFSVPMNFGSEGTFQPSKGKAMARRSVLSRRVSASALN